MRKKTNLKYFVLSVISGILLALSFQKFNAFFLAWIGFIPLLFCCNKENTILKSVFYGFISGFVCNCISLFWLYPFLNYNLESYSQAIIVAGLLCGYLACYFAVWTGFVNLIQKKFVSCIVVLFAPCLWMLLEYARTYLLTGFPWNLIGYSQTPFLYFIQISDIFSVYGVSFIIVLINVMIFCSIKEKRLLPLIAVFIVFLSVISYGFIRIKYLNIDNDNEIVVGVIQPNVDQYKKWDLKYKESIIKEIKNSAKTFENQNIDMMVYPETVIPGFFGESDIEDLIEEISSIAKMNLIGLPCSEEKSFYNSIVAFDNKSNVIDKHYKTHLVIFGEFIPFRDILAKFFSIFNSLGDFSKGTQMNVFNYENISVGSSICSENFFSNLSRKLVNNGAKILTNHTNDAWFLDSAAPYQHFSMNIFRAIENRKYMVVCANTGLSAVIDLKGKILQKTQLNENINFSYPVYQNSYKTLYDKFGNVLIYIGLLIVTFIFFMLFMI